MHPWVVGELSLGHLGRRRAVVLADLHTLPAAPLVADPDVGAMIEAHGLAGSGIGWVDAQLLASALAAAAALWMLDRRLTRLAATLGLEA